MTYDFLPDAFIDRDFNSLQEPSAGNVLMKLRVIVEIDERENGHISKRASKWHSRFALQTVEKMIRFAAQEVIEKLPTPTENHLHD